MKRLLPIILFFCTLSSSAQLHDKFPFNEKNEIVFSEVLTIEDISKQNLYLKGKEFFVNNFKSANHVIQMDSKEDGIIIGKGFNTIHIIQNKISVPVNLNFTIKVEFKDNRYRYEIYGLNYESKLAKFSAEYLFSKAKDVEYKKSKKKYQDIADQYRDQTLLTVDNLISNLIEFMESNRKNAW